MLVEKVAESDDNLMEKYLEADELTVEELRPASARCTIAFKVNPVFCGTAFKNMGVQPMLDAVIDYLPSPLDVPAIEGHRPGHDEEIVDAPGRRERAVLGAGVQDRVDPSSASSPTSGSTPARGGRLAVVNSTKGKKERIGKCSRCTPTRRTPSTRRPPATSSR